MEHLSILLMFCHDDIQTYNSQEVHDIKQDKASSNKDKGLRALIECKHKGYKQNHDGNGITSLHHSGNILFLHIKPHLLIPYIIIKHCRISHHVLYGAYLVGNYPGKEIQTGILTPIQVELISKKQYQINNDEAQ